MNKTAILTALIASVFLISLASAVTVINAEADTITPGQSGNVNIEIKNILNDDIQEVSVSLVISGTTFTTVGGSEDSVDEIQEDDKESFDFTIKASSTAKPGNYEIPYSISYTLGNATKTKTGSLGVTVKANPELSFTAQTENPVIGQKGKIKLQIVNKGLGDATFVSVNLVSAGYTLLSDSQVYIGSVASDDYETATFDVIFDKADPVLSAIVEYRDFDNKKLSQTINIPLNVYTKDKALQLGITTQSKTGLYVLVLLIILIVIFIVRAIRKRRRLKRSMQLQGGNK